MTDELPDSLYLNCEYCGDLGWTIGLLGHVAHKHECPHRSDAYCQTHPHGCPKRLVLRPMVPVFAGLVALISGGGWVLAQHLSTTPLTAESTLTLPGETGTITIKKVTKGRVITLPGGTKVVHVPAVIIHAKGRRIIVPAHNLKIHRVDRLGGILHATVAEPLIPVTVTVFVPTTVIVPTTVTETVPPVTVTSTFTETVPLLTSGPDPT